MRPSLLSSTRSTSHPAARAARKAAVRSRWRKVAGPRDIGLVTLRLQQRLIIIRPVVGLSPYGDAAINSACDAIVRAGRGEQERVINTEAFSIGTFSAPVPFLPILHWALLRGGAAMPDHDLARPWRPQEIETKIRHSKVVAITDTFSP